MLPSYLDKRSLARNLMMYFCAKENYYKIICNRYCSPAKIIKRYLKPIFESIYGELRRKNFEKLSDLETIDIFISGNDYKCIFNSVVYSEVLDLYLVYLSLYKKYGFTKDYLDKVIKDADYENLKLKINFFDLSEVKWKKRIRLSPEDKKYNTFERNSFFY